MSVTALATDELGALGAAFVRAMPAFDETER